MIKEQGKSIKSIRKKQVTEDRYLLFVLWIFIIFIC